MNCLWSVLLGWIWLENCKIGLSCHQDKMIPARKEEKNSKLIFCSGMGWRQKQRCVNVVNCNWECLLYGKSVTFILLLYRIRPLIKLLLQKTLTFQIHMVYSDPLIVRYNLHYKWVLFEASLFIFLILSSAALFIYLSIKKRAKPVIMLFDIKLWKTLC